MKCVDLHIHSLYSDGVLSPSEIVKVACHTGIDIISITDHDTVEGYGDINDCNTNLQIIPGIEFSTYDNFESVHILGYYLDIDSDELCDYVNKKKKKNIIELKNALMNLRRKGIKIDLRYILSRYKRINIKILKSYLLTSGICANEKEVLFNIYANSTEMEKVIHEVISTRDCIQLIHKLHGIAVLAHPLLLGKDFNCIYQKIIKYKQDGLDGIECIHPKHRKCGIEKVIQCANELDLLITGGSDYHGRNCDVMGSVDSFGKIYSSSLDNKKGENIINRFNQQRYKA